MKERENQNRRLDLWHNRATSTSEGGEMTKNKPLNPNAITIEEAFFAQENAKLLEKLREEARMKERRDSLRAVLRVDDESVVDALIEMDLYPETVVAFGLVPMIEVAWADGEISPKEREAVLVAAAARGVEKGSTTYELLENWLQRKHGPELLDTWKQYVAAISAQLDGAKNAALKERVLGQARAVAEAAGGILGLGFKVSASEEKVLDELEAAFDA
jgi:hypothetical protein